MRKIIAILLTVISLAACNLPMPTPMAVNPPADSSQCYFNWASQNLPELSTQIETKIKAARLTGVSARAEAYGENCIDPQTNKPVSFGAMETDFHITAKVDDLSNKDELGNLLEKILVILDGFPVGKIPGPQPGYINISFQSGMDEINIMFNITAGKSARTVGLHGAALFDELNKK